MTVIFKFEHVLELLGAPQGSSVFYSVGLGLEDRICIQINRILF